MKIDTALRSQGCNAQLGHEYTNDQSVELVEAELRRRADQYQAFLRESISILEGFQIWKRERRNDDASGDIILSVISIPPWH